MHRREFLNGSLAASLAMTASGVAASLANTSHPLDAAEPERSATADYPIAAFTKVFQTHAFDEFAEAVVRMGVEGVEATIREGGHIDPKDASSQIPQMIAALSKRNKRLLIAATGITRVDDATKKFLRVLKDNGVGFYRLGYYRYQSGSSRISQLRTFAAQAKELAALNQELGIVGVLQNHSGENYLGNLVWDYAVLLESIDPQWLGVGLDLRHLRVEIAESYQSAIEAIRPNLRTVYVKDARRLCEGTAGHLDVPLGEGMVDRGLFRNVWRGLRPCPIALHIEHLGQKPLSVDQTSPIIEAYRKDASLLREWMKA